MAKIKVEAQTTGVGIYTVKSGTSATSYTATLPDATGTLVNTAPSTSGNVLTSDGTNWTSAAAAAGGIMQTPYFAAKVSSNQAITHNVWTKVNFASETLDSDSCYDTSNYRFTPTTSGNYLVYVETNIHDLTSGYYMISAAYKNGSVALLATSAGGGGQNAAHSCFGIINMNGTSDYIEGYVKIQNNAGNKDLLANGATATPQFIAWRIG